MSHLRLLVACAACRRQYDASERRVGSQFRCLCGDCVEVPAPRPHEAAVVRCSSCGGPRMEGATACSFCSGDFTLHELDLDTLCPRCMTRISRSARFCHSCASPILVAGSAGQATVYACPICPGEQTLSSRRLTRVVSTAGNGSEASRGDGDSTVACDLTALECGNCAGLWLDTAAFRLLADRARSETLPVHGHSEPISRPIRTLREQSGPAYRSCPVCGALMHRQNYGRRSGVILDICKQHGAWFDDQELEAVLDWVRRGGDEVVARLEGDEQRDAVWRERQRKLAEPTEVGSYEYERSRPTLIHLLEALAEAAGRFF